MTLHVNAIIRLRPQQLPHIAQALRHERRPVHLHVVCLHDTADFGEGGGDLGTRCEVLLRRVHDEDVLERDGEVQSGILQRERVAVVGGVGGAHGFAEGGRFRARGRGDNGGEVEVRACDLRRHGPDT
jgi:hypothetical protein